MRDDTLRGGATRRTVMAGAAAAGVAAGMVPAIRSSRAQAAEPKRGGTLRVGIGHGSTTDSTDPATYENGYTAFQALGGVHNYLTAVNEVNALVPELATEWDSNADGSTWTFKLRQGVEFHNGKTVDANDVVASINHHRGPDSKSGAAGILTPITDVKADGNTVVVTLKGPNADFPFLMSDYHLAILPLDGSGKVDTGGVGAGGYVLKEFEPGVRSYLTRNPNYWKTGYAWFDDSELTSIIDVTARQNALASGQVDLIDRVDPKTANLLAQSPGIELNNQPSALHYTLPMLTDVAPFDDNNVRLALKHALNRDEVVQKILQGFGSAGNDQPIAPVVPFYDASLKPFPYDPDKARYYLKQAGLNRLKVDLSTSDAAFVGAVDMAVLYKENAAAAGIDINVVRESSDGYWANVWMKKPWSTCYWGGRPTEDWMFSTTYAADAPWNDTHWKNERFNELLIKARGELDQSLRAEMYHEMQKIVRDEGGVVVAMFANNVDGYSTRLAHGEHVAGNWAFDGDRAMERWWFKNPSA